VADTTGRVLAAPQRASKIRCWPSATLGKPETFDFLGFTHCCSTKRNGDFQVLRLTAKKRMRATLLAIRDELQRRRVMSPSGLKGSGSIGWLAAISTTTRCRATCSALTVFGQLSAQAASPQAVQPDLQSLSGGTLHVTNLRQEPYAVVPHVRICARGWQVTAIPTATLRSTAAGLYVLPRLMS